MTGAIADRPGIKAMLKYLRKHRSEPHVVIIDDITRLARDFRTHFDLRDAVTLTGAFLESPTFVFGDDPDSELHEGIEALFSHAHRRKNAAQVKRRMLASVMMGYFVFRCPIGYRYQNVVGQGKMLVRDDRSPQLFRMRLRGMRLADSKLKQTSGVSLSLFPNSLAAKMAKFITSVSQNY